ncbi:hypothetical protein E7T06_08370 [Deinococcus sp. Arct2-2]|uniref:sensor histidine kinase n=1 Tax=Deinococcus sp. Arct2-2 TaxID=2568653 RepID=UPI0010A38E28|nr:histidine kinase [Deinococcus sp. Arct2-2]THF70190.1 hypothetical protein E7T06_08370 [Deinococcus sp. Arct2-2]
MNSLGSARRSADPHLSRWLSPTLGFWVAWLVYAGEAVLIGLLWQAQPDRLTVGLGGVGVISFLFFGVGLAGYSLPRVAAQHRLGAVVLMSLSSVAFNLVFSHLEAFTALALQVVSAVAIVTVVPVRAATLWIVVQASALAWANSSGVPATFALLLYPGYMLMQLFSAHLMQLVWRERRQQLTLINLNAELQAARDAVAAASQDAERHRIARDLHDTLGHRLVALGLELEFAQQLAEGEVAASVARANLMNRQLLSEVRETIRDVRHPSLLPLPEAFEALATHLPIEFKVECGGVTLSAELREVYLKCAREALTNAVRHAGAQRVSLHLLGRPQGSVLRIENDGWVAGGSATAGQGLRGMRERLSALGGTLHIYTERGRFVLEACVPSCRP